MSTAIKPITLGKLVLRFGLIGEAQFGALCSYVIFLEA